MSVVPINPEKNTWLICFAQIIDGEQKVVKEEFVGSIKEAMSYEKQLRGSSKGNLNQM